MGRGRRQGGNGNGRLRVLRRPSPEATTPRSGQRSNQAPASNRIALVKHHQGGRRHRRNSSHDNTQHNNQQRYRCARRTNRLRLHPIPQRQTMISCKLRLSRCRWRTPVSVLVPRCHPDAPARRAKAELRVRERGMSANQAATRIKLNAAPISRCMNRVFTRPM